MTTSPAVEAHAARPDPLGAVLGQEAAVRALRRAVEQDRLASAYLFEGPSGTGKALAARALAETVLTRGLARPAADDVARRIASGVHPDVRVLSPRAEGDRNLKVEVVRTEILPFAQFAPFEGRAAFLVFPDADVSLPEHHAEAANALLKTLEEPRPGVHFVLLSSRPERLLSTIRSRCQRLRFQRLGDDTLERILAAAAVSEPVRAVAIALADGRADRALALAEVGGDGRSMADALFDTAVRVSEAIDDGRPAVIVALAEDLAKAPDLGAIFEALTVFHRDVACAALGASDALLAFRHRADLVRQRAERIGVRRAADAVLGLRDLEERIATHANKELAIADWLFSVARGAAAPRSRRRQRA